VVSGQWLGTDHRTTGLQDYGLLAADNELLANSRFNDLTIQRINERGSSPRRAFTLIELLVVIAIMAILAALIFPVTSAINKIKIRSRARSEMNQIVTAIESYKARLGHYPPDNAPSAANPNGRWDVNQLYYELLGTRLDPSGTVYTTLDGRTTITNNQVTTAFPAAQGFVNSTKGATGDEGQGAANYFPGLKPGEYMTIVNPYCTVLGASLDTTNIIADAGNHKFNPWCYNSSSPTNNPRSYDLWMDIPISGKINRICNWSEKPIIY